MMKVFTVSFFGHREISRATLIEERLEAVIRRLLWEKEYVEFLVGRNGDFDLLVSSVIHRTKRTLRNDNSVLVLVLAYLTAEYRNNIDSFQEYYDEIEICSRSEGAHFKAAIQRRNRAMVDRSDLVVCCIEHGSGGAYRTMEYAHRQGIETINLADIKEEWGYDIT